MVRLLRNRLIGGYPLWWLVSAVRYPVTLGIPHPRGTWRVYPAQPRKDPN